MKIIKISGNDCGGFKPPKGHLDTQLFPECAETETDRNVVRKTLKRRKKASIITAKHGNNILGLWRAWVNKKLDNESFIGAVYSMLEEVSEPFIRKGISRLWAEYQQTQNSKLIAEKMAALLGQDPMGFQQRTSAVELKPRFCTKCKQPVGKMSESAWLALNKLCDNCSGTEQEVDKLDPALYRNDDDIIESKDGLKQHKKAQTQEPLEEVEEVGDVWDFETTEEDLYAELLNELCTKAIEGDIDLQRYLTGIFGGNWESVKAKLLTEGSVWYVWWKDGLNKFIELQKASDFEVQGKNMQVKTVKTALISSDGYADGGEPYTDDELDLMQNTYYYYINLDERGSFLADVRDSNEQTVFTIKAGDELKEGESSIFEDGFMRHSKDLEGLKKYLVHLGIMRPDQKLRMG